MGLSVTNDPQTEYYIVVEEDDKIRNDWSQVFDQMPHAVPVVTDSITEALCAWSRLFLNDCLPRCVIVNWDMTFNELGPHYFMRYCLDISDEGAFIVCADNAIDAVKKLQDDPLVGSHVTVIKKDKYSVQQTLDLVNQTPAFARQNSGFFMLG